MVHKVFVSYYHDNDQTKADYLRTHYGENNTLLDRSLSEAYEVSVGKIGVVSSDYVLILG